MQGWRLRGVARDIVLDVAFVFFAQVCLVNAALKVLFGDPLRFALHHFLALFLLLRHIGPRVGDTRRIEVRGRKTLKEAEAGVVLALRFDAMCFSLLIAELVHCQKPSLQISLFEVTNRSNLQNFLLFEACSLFQV